MYIIIYQDENLQNKSVYNVLFMWDATLLKKQGNNMVLYDLRKLKIKLNYMSTGV